MSPILEKEELTNRTQKSFDVIIVDYDMPDNSGIAFVKILRGSTPIIMFTGIGGDNAAVDALSNRTAFFLKKM